MSTEHTIRLALLLLLIMIGGGGLYLPPTVRAAPGLVLTPTVTASTVATPTVAPPTAAPSTVQTATPLPSIVHVVIAGDTLSGIANQYGVTVAQIIVTNQLRDPNYLVIGQRIVIYTEAAAVAVTPTAVTPAPTTAAPQPAAPQPFADEFICPGNTRTFPLVLPSDPIHMHLVGDQLLLIADGDLYRLPVDSLVESATPVESVMLTPTNLMPPTRLIAGYPVRELVYGTVDRASGDLFVLDKSDDIYRYSVAGQWRMAFPAAPVPDQFPDPQYLAIQVDESGAYALDADLSRIWALRTDVVAPQVYMQAAQLLNAADFVMLNATGPARTFGVLLRDGSISQFGQGALRSIARATANPDRRPWPAQLLLADNTLYAVDGESRTITAIDPQSHRLIRKITFRLPDLQRVRSAVVQADRVYAVAGRTLYVSDLHDSETCPAVRYDNNYYFADSNLQEVLASFQLPYPTTVLPDRPRSYPGARRLYR
ncbi:MAG: LysM peptidoglycan-binding domain-containing protein, partial [Caldilineaceae bacterium]|nr:LysM peptidoglycan-binding domain-containing protein [Caldilineaceae bacterium]